MHISVGWITAYDFEHGVFFVLFFLFFCFFFFSVAWIV